ncbi:MAG: Ig-like domain-containing protein [Bacteroidales bacterium]|nr:Ig-like domain-containing protein [Bacteroidales bacterium]
MKFRLIFALLPLTMLTLSCSGTAEGPDDTGTTDGSGDGSSKPRLESISITPDHAELAVGDTIRLEAALTPSDAEASLSWSSSDKGIATVDNDGLVTAIAGGEAVITVKSGKISAQCPVNVSAGSKVVFSNIGLSDLEFSSVTLSGSVEVSGCPEQYSSAAFYYMKTDANPTAEEIWENGTRYMASMMSLPGSGDFSASISKLDVAARYCYIVAMELYEEHFFSEVHDFTTTDLQGLTEITDMGLSVKWRGWNVGASKPEDLGSFYTWGEITPKDNYVWETYPFRKSYDTMSKYVTNASDGYNRVVDGKTILESSDDAATMNLGAAWRTPTFEEMTELKQNVVMKWTRYHDVPGIVMTSKVNGAKLFFPAAGQCYGDSSKPGHVGDYGNYWTSSLYPSNNKWAYILVLKPQILDIVVAGGERYMGFSVRPVGAQ